MPVNVTVNGRRVQVPDGATVVAACAGVPLRRSITGEPRGALCGMGICFECRLTIDGQPHQRACQTLVREGMEITTGAD